VQSATCPFVASLGAKPARLSGRAPLLDALGDSLGALHRAEPARPLAWLGRVGVGRTALLHEAARRASAQGWAAAVITIVRDSPIEHELARGVAAALVHYGRRHADEPKLVELLGVARAYAAAHDLDLPIEAPMPEISWPGSRRSDAGALLERVADGLRAIGSGCFLAIDDLDHAPLDARLDIVGAVTQLAGAGRSVLVAVTGLPGTVPDSLARCHELATLSPPEVLDALAGPAAEHRVEVGHETVAAIGRRTGGHPYFVQAFARAAWLDADGPALTPELIAAVALRVERELRSSFFAPVLDGLSPAELRFVRAVADAEENEGFAEIARRLGDAVRFDPATSRLAPVLAGLVDRGVLYTDGDDRLRFALPYFERYVHSTD
jgi:hypothetical protein